MQEKMYRILSDFGIPQKSGWCLNLNIKGKVPILEALFSILLNLYWKSNQG
jgi:hypothetical protein